MLRITVPAREFFDDERQEFVEIKEQTLTMEHSLISISKWEAKWKKPYFPKDKSDVRTQEELLDYLRCMTITPSSVNPLVFRCLTSQNIRDISDYINDPMTATTIYQANPNPSGRKQVVTSELIYYWMIAQNIPTEYEKWHINRLLTLIRVCSIKNDPNPKKMNRAAIARQNKALNAARRAKYGTKG